MNKKNIIVLFNALIMTEYSFGYASVIKAYIDSIYSAKKNGKFSNIFIYIICQRRALSQLDPDGILVNSNYFKFILIPNLNNVILRSLFEQIFLNVVAVYLKCNLIHMPATLGLIFSVRPQLLFFHASTTFMLERKMHGRSFISTWLQNFVIKFSSKSTTILATGTHTTAGELFSYFKFSRSYSVLGDGVRKFPPPSIPIKVNSLLKEKNFGLYVSSFYELKNQLFLISYFKKNKIRDDFYLILVGGKSQSSYYNLCLELSKFTSNIIIADDVNDSELSWLYENCSIYINPSLFEGFSLTPMEALSFKKPIILSDIPVHREVYGDNFIYFDPASHTSLGDAINKALTKEYKSSCLQYSEPLLEKYTWDNFAIKNVEIYKDICKKNY